MKQGVNGRAAGTPATMPFPVLTKVAYDQTWGDRREERENPFPLTSSSTLKWDESEAPLVIQAVPGLLEVPKVCIGWLGVMIQPGNKSPLVKKKKNVCSNIVYNWKNRNHLNVHQQEMVM